MSNEIILPRLVANGSKIDREMNKKIIRRNADRRKALEYCWDCVHIEHCTKMIKEMETQAKEEVSKKAKEYVVTAIQKCAAD